MLAMNKVPRKRARSLPSDSRDRLADLETRRWTHPRGSPNSVRESARPLLQVVVDRVVIGFIIHEDVSHGLKPGRLVQRAGGDG